MSLSTPFIHRPIATTLLAVALVLVGAIAWLRLPVAALPDMSMPTITVQASLSGANPETMASTVATPLERALGQIAGINQITSTSAQGSTRVVIQFNLEKDINEAAREVQAAINSAQALLPTAMTRRPTYQKVNPADSPLLIIALSSPRLSQGELYDLADRVVSPRILRVPGVGSINVGGSSSPAVRVALDPRALEHAGISLDAVRAAIDDANSNQPKGSLRDGDITHEIDVDSQLFDASGYRALVVATSEDGRQITRLGDVANVSDGVENPYSVGFFNQQPAVILVVRPSASANIVETVERIREQLPAINALLPSEARLDITLDRSPGIRASLSETQATLLLGILLVVGVIFVFLRSVRATLIPSVVIPVTLIGTFAVLHLFGLSLNTMTLMALIVSIGFVVDDAIVVVENIARHIERGTPPIQAAIDGSREMSFTIMSMSISLVAVLVPLLLIQGLIGRLFSAFSIALAASILISMLVSLTLTPMLCARTFAVAGRREHPRWQRMIGRFGSRIQNGYARTLAAALAHPRLTLLSLFAVIALNGYLYTTIPKSFIPEQDSGRILTAVRADQNLGFEAMRSKFEQIRSVLLDDARVESVVGFVSAGGNDGGTSAFMSISLKEDRDADTQTVANQLSAQLDHFAGLQVFMFGAQDIRVGGRSGGGQYELTLRGDNLERLDHYASQVTQALQEVPEITGVNSDQRTQGQSLLVEVDRDLASRLGVDMRTVDTMLQNAFAQRQVSSVYQGSQQYYVVMEVEEMFRDSPTALDQLHVIDGEGRLIPLSTFARIERSVMPVQVNHQGQFAATTVSFNLADDVALSDAVSAIQARLDRMALPNDIMTSFEGNAASFQQGVGMMPWLIVGALVAVYLVLGMLYESYVHPLTILSTLPSAGVGALLALKLLNEPFSLIALIGVILLIGVVKKNAILLVDFALEAERHQGLTPTEAITQAALVRFRPIMMTTLAAILGAVPLLVGTDENAQLRAPLGITIVGGLIVSQVLTLYTTPVVYLYFDRLRGYFLRRTQREANA